MMKSHSPVKVQIVQQPTIYNLIIKLLSSEQQEEISTNDFVRKIDEGQFELEEEEQFETVEEHEFDMAV